MVVGHARRSVTAGVAVASGGLLVSSLSSLSFTPVVQGSPSHPRTLSPPPPARKTIHLLLDHTVDELVAFSEGVSALNPKAQREGVVLRPPVEEHDPDVGGRLSFKVINPRFLLKYDE